MVRSSLVTLAGLALVTWLAAACGGGGEGSPAATPEPSPALTAPASPTPLPAASVALPTPITTPVVIGGITLYPFDAWIQQRRSGCPVIRLGSEGSYAAPELYSIRQEDLPDLNPLLGERSRARVCKSGGVTAIEYASENVLVIRARTRSAAL